MDVLASSVIEISWPFAIAMMVVCMFGAQYIMQPKGYGPIASRALGFFLGPIGVVIALLLPDKRGAGEADSAKALREYKRLLDEGGITQEEYERKKRELLS